MKQTEAAVVVVGHFQKDAGKQVVLLSCLVEEAQQTTVRWQMRHGSGSRAVEEEN